MSADKENGDATFKGRSVGGYDNPSDKMWSIYVAEAGKFDKGLVDSWRGDMEGILIFAGLFSASVTAFIIESYKKLSPDSGDMTVALLAQISSQLVAISNGTNLATSSPSPTHGAFKPTSSAVVANVFFFLSLALALVCAIHATMVEPWARNYLQLIERHPAPDKRARIRAYLYEGIKTFKMTALVEAIPTLLHVSLFLFFNGLIVFLFPIDLRVALPILMTHAFGISLYIFITFLPMICQNCPYQSPLSPTFWRLLQRLNRLRYRDSSGNTRSICGNTTDVREQVATAATRQRDERDMDALRWMLTILTGDSELERFLDAIPEFLNSEDGKRLDRKISPEFQGIRIWRLLDACRERTSLEVSRRRSVICMAALQAMITRTTWPPTWPTHSQCETLVAFQKDSDCTTATLAMCTSASMLSVSLSAFTLEIRFKSHFCKNAADERLLREACDQLPVDDWAASRLTSNSLIIPDELSSDSVEGIMRLLRNDDLLDAVDRYLYHEGHSRLTARIKYVLAIFEDSGVEIDGLSRSLRWLSEDVIRDAKEAVRYLRNPDGNLNGWSTKRAVSGMLGMLQSVKMMKMPDEFLNFGRSVIVNSLLSQLTHSQHDTREHSPAVLETLQRLIQPKFTHNDADIETQTKFLLLMKDAISQDPPPLSFPVVQVLLHLFKNFEQPTSIASAIDVIDGNPWLRKNGFPLEESLKRLKEKLAQRSESTTLEHPVTSQQSGEPSGSIDELEGISGNQGSPNGEEDGITKT